MLYEVRKLEPTGGASAMLTLKKPLPSEEEDRQCAKLCLDFLEDLVAMKVEGTFRFYRNEEMIKQVKIENDD